MLLALVIVLLIVLWYLYLQQKKSCNGNLPIATSIVSSMTDEKQDESSSPIDMTNESVDRGINASNPQPDVQHCYWGSDLSQDLVDQLDRLNTADYVTPMVLSRSGMYQSCACNCLGDLVGKVVYD